MGQKQRIVGSRMPVGAMLRDACSGDPDTPALRCNDIRVSRTELTGMVQAAATVLRREAVCRGDRVAMLAENCLDILYFYYACAHVGAVFIPLNANLTASDVRYVMEHSGARLLLHDDALAQVAEEAAPQARRLPIAGLSSSALADCDLAPEQDSGDFLIIYTSGTTGLPKAAVFDQQAEFEGNRALIEMWDMTPRDVTLVALPLGFLYGLSTAAATALQAGGEVVVLPRFHPRDVLDAMLRTGATVFHGVPTMFAMMLQYAEQNDLEFDLSNMRLLISAGAPLPHELRERFRARFGKTIDDYYALTEVRPVFGRHVRGSAQVPRGSLGTAAPGARIRIVDGRGNQLADGETGEVLVRAASTLDRYLGNDEQTKAAFHDGYFRTGDLGYRDSEGFYYLTGRIKDIVIRGGANISPAEIEHALNAHPSVSAAAVFGIADEVFGEVPAAYVVLRPGRSLDVETLIEHCKASLAAFKIPNMIRAIDELPLGKTGKVDKAALAALWKASR